MIISEGGSHVGIDYRLRCQWMIKHFGIHSQARVVLILPTLTSKQTWAITKPNSRVCSIFTRWDPVILFELNRSFMYSVLKVTLLFGAGREESVKHAVSSSNSAWRKSYWIVLRSKGSPSFPLMINGFGGRIRRLEFNGQLRRERLLQTYPSAGAWFLLSTFSDAIVYV